MSEVNHQIEAPEDLGGKAEDVPGVLVQQEKLHVVESRTQRDKARAANLMGYSIVGGFVLTTVLTVCTGLWSHKLKPNEAYDFLKAITTVFGAPLGFVLGFYYGVAKK